MSAPREVVGETQLIAQRSPGENSVRLVALAFPDGPRGGQQFLGSRSRNKNAAVVVSKDSVLSVHDEFAEAG